MSKVMLVGDYDPIAAKKHTFSPGSLSGDPNSCTRNGCGKTKNDPIHKKSSVRDTIALVGEEIERR